MRMNPRWTCSDFFFCSGGGRGSPRRRGGVGRFVIENPRTGWGGARGWKGVSGECGGGAKHFFRGRNSY